ncbi:MAG: FAD-binding oxidoreductase [Planctomycetes bacterium]|nr:FAD-binding oxidoreductase [Planctomycetota bacterium]
MADQTQLDHHWQVLGGWGRSPVETCRVVSPASGEALSTAIRSGACASYVPRGLGRAYGDSALNRDAGVLDLLALPRMFEFDESQGLLHCDGAISFDTIIGGLLPRGWFLPVTPGTRFVTVGGALAADVHGKNHHRVGSIAHFVAGLQLQIASGEVLDCSPERHAELFWATLGGMGLTGVIVSASLRMQRVPSAFCQVRYERTADLDQTLTLFDATNNDYAYSVAWVDCLARGGKLGRSVVMLANDAAIGDLPGRFRHEPHAWSPRREFDLPWNLPALALNRWTVRAFNALYYLRHRPRHIVAPYASFFYPLDRVRHWNRAYGRRGFVQYQALFPPETSRQGLSELLGKLAHTGRAPFLAVLKRSGPASPGPLSYMYPGHTLALDLADTGNDLRQLTRELDRILLRHGGRLYLAKDALTDAATFRAMYPRLAEFQAIKRQVDPHQRFSSSQARRVGIV